MIRLTFTACLLTMFVTAQYQQPDVIYEWKTIDYNNRVTEGDAVKELRNLYTPENNAISGIKIWKGYIYLTIPRWRSGVPVTLARVPLTPMQDEKGNNINPKLDAYPDWDMQAEGDCDKFQSVQNMEIDPRGRMWVLDVGRTETMTDHLKAKCAPRLVILDLENGGAVLKTFKFPEEVASYNSSHLNDIVLDHQDGGYAYISDGGLEPAIIVYSLKDNKAWKVNHDSMKAEQERVDFRVANTNVRQSLNIDGIALSPPEENRTLYYSSVSSFHLYSIPVKVLQNYSITDVQENVTEVGRRNSQTRGMVMSNTGVLYYGLLADDEIRKWNTTVPFGTQQKLMYRDHDLYQWPDTFAFDEDGLLWWVTNRFQNFFNDEVNPTEINYRIICSNVSDSVTDKSYQYLRNGTAPELPVINAASGQIRIAISTAIAVLLVFLAC